MVRIQRRIAIVGLVAIVSVLASCAPGGLGTAAPLPTATSGPVTLRTNAASYHAGDTVTVTLRNGTSGSIHFQNQESDCGVLIVRRLEGGAWKGVDPCPRLGLPTLYVQLDAGQSQTERVRPDTTGTYRVELEYFTAFDGTPSTVVSSAGFQVT
jgi:hypothetical protein